MEMIEAPVAYPYTDGGNARVQQLIGLLQQQTLTVAGLGKDGRVVQAEQTTNIGNAREKMGLLRSGVPLKTIFYQPEAWLLTPTQLFKEEEAATWLCQLFPCMPVAVKSAYISRVGLHLTYAEPPSLQDDISPLQQQISFKPLPLCLLAQPEEGFMFCVTSGIAFGFLYYGGQLKWYQQFDVTTGEDILWQALQAAKSAGLRGADIRLQLFSTEPGHQSWRTLLQDYFVVQQDEVQGWESVLPLFQTMGACAS